MPGRHAAPECLSTGRGRGEPTRRLPGAHPGLVALGVVAAGVVVAARILRRVEVRGPSMRPALEEGDRLLCWPAWGMRVGDVVVVAEPGTEGLLAVKRVANLWGGTVEVLGDNGAASLDSRAYGPLPRSAVRGRAWWRYHPPERAGRLGRAGRGEPARRGPPA